MAINKGKKAGQHHEPGVAIAKDSIQFTTASVVRAAGTLLMLILLARLLRPADFGLYSIVFALVTLLGLNTDYGVGNALRKKLPELRSISSVSTLISNSFAIALLASLVIAAVGVALSGYIALHLYHEASLALPIIIGAALMPFSALFTVTSSTLLGLRKSGKASAGFVMHSIFQLIFSVGLVLLGYGISGALLGMLLGYVVAFIFTFALLRLEPNWKFSMPQWGPIREVAYFSAPIFSANAAGSGVRNLGVLLLGLFVSAIVIGNYSAAFRLGSFGDVILGGGMSVLLPGFSYAASGKASAKKMGSMLNSSIFYTLLLLLPLLAYLVSVSRPLIYLIFSSSYSLAPIYFPIIAVGIVAAIVSKYGGLLLIGYGKVKAYAKYQFAGAAVIVVLLALLAPTLQVAGVIATLFIISPILLALLFGRALVKELKVHLNLAPLAKLAAVSLVLWLFLTALDTFAHLGSLSLLVNAIAVVILYPVLLAAFRTLVQGDLEFMHKVGESMHLGPISGWLARYTRLFMPS
jgi:O-antigen/teichoic acid export membrane protein